MIGSDKEQPITNDQYSYYSIISNPSFKAFDTLDDYKKAKLIESYVREVMLANLGDIQAQVILNAYYLIDYCLQVEEFDLTISANSAARDILSYAVVSMGSKQEFLKKLLTNYSISETKTEERAYAEFKEQKKDEDQKKWKFFK